MSGAPTTAQSGSGGGCSRTPDGESLTAAAVGRAVRAATEAHLVCYGAFAVATALAELRGGAAAPASTRLPFEAAGGDAALDEDGSEADYEPGS